MIMMLGQAQFPARITDARVPQEHILAKILDI
jgi:hypothetical protein